MQAALLADALAAGAGFMYRGGRLSLTTANTRRAGTAALALEASYKQGARQIAAGILSRILRLLRGNQRYFSKLGDASSIEEQAIRRVLLAYGYDPATGRIIPGGYIDAVLSSAPIGREVARQMNAALLQGMGVRDFRRTFRQAFAPAQGLGLLERHFARFTHDLFMEVDRSAKALYAEELGLEHFIYAGTEVERTREFCERRMNRIYTVDFAEGWDSLTWQGKIPGRPVMQQLGGYNCRHSPMFISAEMAEMLAARRGEPINSLGAARPRRKRKTAI